jgi:hypothetical protein
MHRAAPRRGPAPPPSSSASKMIDSDQYSFRKDPLLSVVPLDRRPRQIRLSTPPHHVQTLASYNSYSPRRPSTKTGACFVIDRAVFLLFVILEHFVSKSTRIKIDDSRDNPETLRFYVFIVPLRDHQKTVETCKCHCA